MSAVRMRGSSKIKKERLSVQCALSREHWDKLNAIAEKEDRSVSNLLSIIVKKWLDAQG